MKKDRPRHLANRVTTLLTESDEVCKVGAHNAKAVQHESAQLHYLEMAKMGRMTETSAQHK